MYKRPDTQLLELRLFCLPNSKNAGWSLPRSMSCCLLQNRLAEMTDVSSKTSKIWIKYLKGKRVKSVNSFASPDEGDKGSLFLSLTDFESVNPGLRETQTYVLV